MTRIKTPNCDKKKLKLWQNSIYDKTLKESFNKNNLTPQQPMRCTQGSVLWSCNVFIYKCILLIIPKVIVYYGMLWWFAYELVSNIDKYTHLTVLDMGIL